MRGKPGGRGRGQEGTYQIPISFFSKELDGESTGIAGSICGSFFSADSGKANENGGLFADFAE